MVMAMTDDASVLVRRLADRDHLPPYAGIRIVVNPGTQSLSMGLADRPGEGDVVVPGIEGQIFLTESAADRLDRSTLRVRADRHGSAFYFTD